MVTPTDSGWRLSQNANPVKSDNCLPGYSLPASGKKLEECDLVSVATVHSDDFQVEVLLGIKCFAVGGKFLTPSAQVSFSNSTFQLR